MNPQYAPNQDDLNRQLIDALINNDTESALILVNTGADPNTLCISTPTPSLEPLFNQQIDISPPLVLDKYTAFMLACGLRRIPLNAKYDRRVKVVETPALIQAMLEHGANVNARTLNNSTALHCAVIGERYNTVELLLEYGADITVQNTYGFTPLTWTVVNTTVNSARLLLAHGANPNVQDTSGSTVLHKAIGPGIEGSLIPLLLSYGADPNLPNKKGVTPLMLAQKWKRPDLVVLLERGGGR